MYERLSSLLQACSKPHLKVISFELDTDFKLLLKNMLQIPTITWSELILEMKTCYPKVTLPLCCNRGQE